MNNSQNYQSPLVLSTSDLTSYPRVLTYNCEDCACAVSSEQTSLAKISYDWDIASLSKKWLKNPDIVAVNIDHNYQALFNFVGNGDVTVVNHSAWELIEQFHEPQSIEEVLSNRSALTSNQSNMESCQRLISAGILLQEDHQPKHIHQFNSTLTAWLHVTNACNLRCPYCYLDKNAEKMTNAVGLASVKAIINSAVKHGFKTVKLKYAGGEATLNHKHVINLHDYAQELCSLNKITLQGVILSNGVSFSQKLIESLKARNIKVMISLDGIGQFHDEQRPLVGGGNSFHFVEQTIAHLINANHTPHLSITVTNRNLAGLADVVRFALERKLTFSINFFRENECSNGFHDLKYSEQSMIAALSEAFAVIEELLPPWSMLGAILDRGQLIQPRQRPCGVGQDYIVVNQHGQVAKCHMEIEQTLGDVFTSDPLLLIQQSNIGAQNISVDEKKGCKSCTWRYWCSGGCPVATFKATGRYDIKSPNCNIYKAIYPQALRLEGLRILKYSQNTDVSFPKVTQYPWALLS